MKEVARLFMGEICADNLKELNSSLTYGNLIDSSMDGMLQFSFIMNWLPKWVISFVLNPLNSLFTKDRMYRKYSLIFYQMHCIIINLSWKWWILYFFMSSKKASFATSAKLFDGVAQKHKMAQDYIEKMNAAGIDLLLFPASLVPAPKRVSILILQKIWI